MLFSIKREKDMFLRSLFKKKFFPWEALPIDMASEILLYSVWNKHSYYLMLSEVKKVSKVSKYFYNVCYGERFRSILRKYKPSFETVELEDEVAFFWKNGLIRKEGEENVLLSPNGKVSLGKGVVMVTPNYLSIIESNKIMLRTWGTEGIRKDGEIIIPSPYDSIGISNITLFETSEGLLIRCMDELLHVSFMRVENWYKIHRSAYKTYNGVYECSMTISGDMKYHHFSWKDIFSNRNPNGKFILSDTAIIINTDNHIDLFFSYLHDYEVSILKAIDTHKKEEAWMLYAHEIEYCNSVPQVMGNVVVWGRKVFDVITGKLLFQTEAIINGCTCSGNKYSLYFKNKSV